MRIVATSDTHFPFGTELIPEGDVFIHAGDAMLQGYEKEWHSRVESFKKQEHAVKLYVPGNHDFHVQNYTGPANQDLRRAGVYMLGTHHDYFTHELPDGRIVLGLPYVTNLESWAFNRTEKDLDRLVQLLPKADIVVSHSPPKGQLDRTTDGENAGVKAWYRYIMIHEPEIWICGHIHEAHGSKILGKTTIYNVSMCDHNYIQSHMATVIDVN